MSYLNKGIFSPINILGNVELKFKFLLKKLPTKGNLAYEYNPLLNYRSSRYIYHSDILGNLGTYEGGKFIPAQIDLSNYIDLQSEPDYEQYTDSEGKIILTQSNLDIIISNNILHKIFIDLLSYDDNFQTIWNGITVGNLNFKDKSVEYIHSILNTLTNNGLQVKYKPGTIGDFIVPNYNFKLTNPMEMSILPSYDGSVDIIFNDDLNRPRLVNSRFAVLENNTYQVTNHKQQESTNIYDQDSVDTQTNLIKTYNLIPKLTFRGVYSGGNMPIGSYRFYFKLADNDGNESNIVAESQQVVLFKGNYKYPNTVEGGILNENSLKLIKFSLSNIDKNFTKVNIYYTRSTSGLDGIKTVECISIKSDFKVIDGVANIIISGNETFEEYDINRLNINYENILSAKTHAECQNILFVGNINRFTEDSKDLEDIALRIYPIPYIKESIGALDHDYRDRLGQNEYYNPEYIYNKVSYWDKEIYRFGVVFILHDNSLSHVYNVRGRLNLPPNNNLPSIYIRNQYTNTDEKLFNDNGERQYLRQEENYISSNNNINLENNKGVVRFNLKHQVIGVDNTVTPIGIQFYIAPEVRTYIKTFAKGFFFVRQKRIPITLAQGIVIGRESKLSYLPTLKIENKYQVEGFLDNSGILSHSYITHFKELEDSSITNDIIICPEYSTNLQAFNSIFNGNQITIVKTGKKADTLIPSVASDSNRFYPITYTIDDSNNAVVSSKVISVPYGTPLHSIDKKYFSTQAGIPEKAYNSKLVKGIDNNNNYNRVRGNFGSVIGVETNGLQFGEIVNLCIEGFAENKFKEYFTQRFEDRSTYFQISDRYYSEEEEDYVVYGGDCYACTYTHRMINNFIDSETPINDKFINANTWRDNYDKDDNTKLININRGDVNAVRLGHWFTFKILSNRNLNIRSNDNTYTTEKDIFGQYRTFFPLTYTSDTAPYKQPESTIFNNGFAGNESYYYHVNKPTTPYDKNEYSTRIYYSERNITNFFQNSYRRFLSNAYRDYTYTYGSIVKLLNWYDNLLVICEHGILVCGINEKVLINNSDINPTIYLNTNNVLPETPMVISNTFGTMWAESIITTPKWVYGVDTVAKKIWRTNGQAFEIISDFKVQKFLNDRISLKELEKTPIVGIRNVKSHYNAYKHDVMFTFYDNLYGLEEEAWNLCYNELLGIWITNYSWIPSYSDSINNIYFTFNRDTSKWIAKLTETKGIYLGNPIFTKNTFPILKINIDNIDLSKYNIKYSLVKSGDYDKFTLSKNIIKPKDYDALVYKGEDSDTKEVYTLKVKAELTAKENSKTSYIVDNYKKFESIVYLTPYDNFVDYDGDVLTTAFWKHGQSGIIDRQDEIKPTHWYGKQHPFEIEFIVNHIPQVQKIFNNLHIISNMVEPESLHYEVVGEGYEFADDKSNMYIRQELTKQMLQSEVYKDVLFNRNYVDLGFNLNNKSYYFPLYYNRVDTINELYDIYQRDTGFQKDYQNLSGAEIIWDKQLNEFRIAIHQKAVNIKKHGRLRGNIDYLEDQWRVQIPTINFLEKNEILRKNSKGNPIPSIVLPDSYFEKYKFNINNFLGSPIETTRSWSNRYESRIRDKYIKIRVRYNGKNLVVIQAIKTMFDVSYA